MYNDTVTVFNLHKDTWLPRIIHNVDVGVTSSTSLTPLNGLTKADSSIILIRSNDSKCIDVNGRQLLYVAPKKFAVLENVENVISFQTKTDFVLLGEYESTKPIVDDDFESGFYDMINSERDGVYQISSVAYYSLIPHFEIEAK